MWELLNVRVLAGTILVAGVLGLASPSWSQQGPVPGNRGSMMEGGGPYGNGRWGGAQMMGPGSMMGSGSTWGYGMMGSGSMMGPGAMMMPGGPGQYMDGRLAFLEAELDIRPDQEELWNDFAEAYRAAGSHMQAMHESMWQGDAPEALPERLAWHEQVMSSQLEAMKALREALLPLYQALDEDQKAVADSIMGFM